MSQRIRRGFVVAAVAAVLLMVAPAPSQAAGLRERVTVRSFLERTWERMATLWPGFQQEASRPWEKEGSGIDPNGQPIVPTGLVQTLLSILTNGQG